MFPAHILYKSYINQWLRQEFNYCDALTEESIVQSVSLARPY
jgi:hypothetical protein